MRLPLCFIAATLTMAATLTAQARPAADSARPAPPVAPGAETAPVVTHHEVKVGSRILKYTVTAGMMPLKNDQGATEANIFYMAYTLDGATDRSKRPLMFSFNGGPGSASVWLHLGALGPRRVKMEDEGWLPAAPYQLVDNDQTWLDFTDLVFIDPVGTGYSRAATAELGKKFWSLQGDIRSVGEFIRLYLGRNERWSSPLFLVGESYGTTRAAGLASHLVDRGIALNGVILISTILNFGTTDWSTGNDLPYALYLPTYTATAWYHKKLAPDLQADLRKTLAQAEQWAGTDYLVALARGDRLTGAERERVVQQLARYTGLSPRFVDQSNLRIELGRFMAELKRDDGATVGRLDTRFTGVNALQGSERADFDPSMSAIRPPYTAMFNDYVRRELGYQSDLEYYILGGGIGSRWSFDSDNEYVDVGENLRAAFARNPHMRLFVAFGYYDAATPYFAAQYSLDHLRLPPALKSRVSSGYYEAGHMMYIHLPSLARLSGDVRGFVGLATTP
ncbi:MAG: peptidase serine carboxypeptidase [Gemmatimonadetes bacterium]|nr:peptidase serine carboxypeptidase [Gemmatimonadota bacterium]